MNTVAAHHVDLPIEGMSCASCAARVEKTLHRLDGMRATVDVATEIASVDSDPGRATPETLAEAVERAGYRAAVPAERESRGRRPPLRLAVSAVRRARSSSRTPSGPRARERWRS